MNAWDGPGRRDPMPIWKAVPLSLLMALAPLLLLFALHH